MAQTDERYYATYSRLDTTNEDLSCKVNADAISVGMEVNFTPETYFNDREKEVSRGIVTNLVDDPIGYLPANCARRFCDLAQDGWTVRVAVSAVGFQEATKSFWAEVAIFAYEPQYADALGAFVQGCMDRLVKGERPDIRLGDKNIDAALQDKKYYTTVRSVGHPSLPKGNVYYKKERTQSENLIMSAAERKPGCIVGTVVFYVVAIAVIGAFVYFTFLRS